MRPYAKGALTYGKHIFTANKCTTKYDFFFFVLLLKEYAIVCTYILVKHSTMTASR